MSPLPAADPEKASERGALTAEGLLRRRAKQRPEAPALADPPNREAFGLGKALSLTYRETDAAADALAAHFIALGLEPGDRIAVQLPNFVEHALVLLGAWRAGLTVLVLPMLWREAEIAKVCDEGTPKAIVGISRFAGEARVEGLCGIAAPRLCVRFVLAFGSDLPDGVAALDEALATAGEEHGLIEPRGLRGPALITFTARTYAPFLPVFREEDELLAQGAMTVLALGLDRHDVILNPYPLTGQAGLALGLAPWLIAGGKLVQHQPFDYDVFVDQLLHTGATVTALPAPLRAELAKGGVLQRPQCCLRRLGSVWSPADLAQEQPPAAAALASYFDLYPLGDVASLVLRRRMRADPTLLPLGPVKLGEGADRALFLETKLGGGGESDDVIRVRGPIVARGPVGGPLAADGDGFVGTGLRAERAEGGVGLRLSRDPELFQHGGFNVAASELDALYQACPGLLDAACFALPDPVMGARLIAGIVPRPGEAVSIEAMHGFLRAHGAAPYKFPDRLLAVRHIPRDAQGRVLRDEILQQV